MKKTILSLIICSTFLLSIPTVHAASNEEEVSTFKQQNIELEDDSSNFKIETYGASKPGKNASVHNLDVNAYNYQLGNFGYRLYTDKWITSSSGKITVSLKGFKTVVEYPGATKNKITFILFDSSGALVTSPKTVSSSGTASVTWINIKPDKKYYVCFEVPTNYNRYTGYGTITR